MSAAEALAPRDASLRVVPVSPDDKAAMARFIRLPYRINAGTPTGCRPC
ncbi:hypothetical protein [Aerophototrophica crusticola]